MEVRTDFLVIGSGIAGLFYALKVADSGSVAIITKKARAESNTNYAQGGIATVASDEDSFESHIEDTLSVGVGLCHREAVEVMVREGPQRLRELVELGVEFSRSRERYDLGREGGHSKNRIVHAADHTGREIEHALLARVASHKKIAMYENHLAVDLITEHHLVGIDRGRRGDIHCWGAYVLDEDRGVVKRFLSRITMVATGGLGQVYLHTTNPAIAAGDGIAMAHRAGAGIANMEFIQFHPTTLYDSGSPAFLISEAVRGFGAVLKTIKGEDLMSKYDSRGGLAPRDIVARAIDIELKRSGDEHVHLDLRHLNGDRVRERFPSIYERCRQFGLDMTQVPLPVVPAAHYACGGVVTDLEGRTNIHGLYACGEVGMVGVHGANRLASNSLLEAVVFSYRAAESGKRRLAAEKSELPLIPPWDDSGTFNSEEWVLVSHNRKEIQHLMWDYVGIVRSNLRLDRAKRRLDLIYREVMDFYKKTKVSEGLIELRNLAIVAELIIRSALARKESRGLHHNTDYPNRDDARWLRDTIIDAD